MNLRFLWFGCFLFWLGAATAFPQNEVRLKPFRPNTAAATQSLAGAWKGTFIFKRADNGMKEEVSYLVEVSADLSSLTMTALPPLSSDPDSRTSPVTEGPIPADWDGETLRAHTGRNFEDGKAQISIVKKYVLRLGADHRHIGVSYEVTVKTNRPHDESTNTVRGSGELVRVR